MKHKALILGSVLLGSSVMVAPLQAHDLYDPLLPLYLPGLLLLDSHNHHRDHKHHYYDDHRYRYQHPRSYSYGRAGGPKHKHRHNAGPRHGRGRH